jgi:hypothetical protein
LRRRNVPDNSLFSELLCLAQVVCTMIARLYAGAGYDGCEIRWCCRREGIWPVIRKVGSRHG